MKKKFIILVALILSIVIPLETGLAEQNNQNVAVGSSPMAMYANLKGEFERGDFEKAYDLAIQIEETGQYYSNAGYYIVYLKGWKALQNNDIDTAVGYFRPLADAKFEDSEGYYQYLMGRKEHAEGNYAAALVYYRKAADLGNVEQLLYSSECLMALNAETYAAAERYIEQGNYLLAAQTFESLDIYKDSNTRKKECYYAYAGQLAEKLQYAQAAEIYNSLGLYSNSADLAKKYYSLAQSDISAAGVTDLKADQINYDSIVLSWADNLQLGTYTVTWYPGIMESLISQETIYGNQVMLNGLLPATLYHIVVTSVKNESVHAEINVATQQTPIHNEFRLLSKNVLSYDQQDNYSMTLAQLYSNNKAKVIENDVINLPSRSLAESGKGYMIACNIDRPTTEDAVTYQYLCVLRIGDTALATSYGEFYVPGYLRYVSFYIELTKMFDDIYNWQRGWEGNKACVDLYFDNKLLCQYNMTMTFQQ